MKYQIGNLNISMKYEIPILLKIILFNEILMYM